MIYLLKHKDDEVLRFSAQHGPEPDIKICEVNNRSFLPLDLILSDDGLRKMLTFHF